MTSPQKANPGLTTSLDQLRVGEGGWIESISGPEEFRFRLMEMGMLEEDFVQLIHEAPFGKDPVAVKVRGSILAIRRREARHITIRRLPRL
jgi:Fe2+ transport system protein FeoA